MIVLDEQISRLPLREAMMKWYPGAVVFLPSLRAETQILDDVVKNLLHNAKGATFITTNYKDFWRILAPHPRYCALCIKLPIERWREVSPITRLVLSRPEFNTKRKRIGKIISYRDGVIDHYG